MLGLSPAEWLLITGGAFMMGLAKGGLPGMGNLTVILFAIVFEPKASVGILLPVLMSADIVAILVYRRHVEWGYLRKFLGWMTLGVFVGYLLFGSLSNEVVRVLLGGVVLSMTGLQIIRTLMKRYLESDFAEKLPHSVPFRASLGVLGGFSSMVANAAGPVGQLYFLSVGLPKFAFIGTAAWTFFLVNWIKVPFQVHLGIIHFDSLRISLSLAPIAMLGAFLGPRVVRHIPQRIFEVVVWTFIVVSGVKLLLG